MRGFLILSGGWDELFELIYQLREFAGYGIPDCIFINIKIIVDNFAAHSDNVFPGDFRMLVAESLRNPASSLTDDLYEMSQGQPQGFIVVKGRTV